MTVRTLTISAALNEALREEMTRDDAVIVIGEDIAAYGGTFDVTKGLVEDYGRDRIFGTAISEAAIVGAGVGAALAGMRPVCEIMFNDFLTCGMDQVINNAAVLTYSFDGQLKVPLVIRTSTGTHGGSQHSKCLEAWLAHVPGLKVVMPATARDAKGLLKSAIRNDGPVVVMESRHLYFDEGPVPEEEYLTPIGQADIKRAGTDVSIIACGRSVLQSLEAAEELASEGIDAEVVDVLTVAPLDKEALLGSIEKTKRALIVHEAWRNGGIGAEIAASLYELAFGTLEVPIRRLGVPDVPMPYARPLVQAVSPRPDKIAAQVRELVAE
jgi:pyruvate/2-oxoglutarate/acetoin dehydrogenase E1 component